VIQQSGSTTMRNEANPRRRSIRLAGYDYSQAGAYFITICTHDRMALFGEIIENDVRLNPNGIIVTATWDELPAHYPNVDLDPLLHCG
jgi:REP-associated tyrosine transposase